MPESLEHTGLLRMLVNHVQSTHMKVGDVVLTHDLPGHIGCEKPPSVGGFRPDLYLYSAPLKTVIIGEAKTFHDLDNDHSRAQYLAYVQHLAVCAYPLIILAVPWQLRRRASNMLQFITRNAGVPQMPQLVIDDMLEGL